MTNPESAAEVSVTQRLVAVAAGHYELTALVGGIRSDGRPGADTYTYARLAATVQAAATGLAWRGLRPRDVVGVYVPDAVSFVLAMHAVRAAGGVPTPVAHGLGAAEMAGQLAESGARMLITAPPLADIALAAADRSWVRQVFSFGDAAGTTPFSDLLGRGIERPPRILPHDAALLVFSRGQDGRLRPTPVSHVQMADQMGRMDELAGLIKRDVVVAAPPAGDGLTYTMLIDSALFCGATVVAARTQELARQAAAHHGAAVIVPDGARVRLPARIRVLTAA
ncbi:MAG TPA: AMP-binding protein [Streptosporangiaceae bacterium]|nr:AMP-binding protein [Streptosporangiaceae bacterium]